VELVPSELAAFSFVFLVELLELAHCSGGILQAHGLLLLLVIEALEKLETNSYTNAIWQN
jgi:hypothetical protein